MVHPDEYWQGTEVAYNIVYGGVDLPWEWHDEYKLRNTVYPYYLAFPLWILKITGLDYNAAVRSCPYLAHCFLVCISDWYLWRIGKRTIGTPASRISFILYLTSRTANELMIRCFSNSIETIFYIVAFYYFLDVKNKFNKNIVMMTALISLSFMMRNTSPIGWIPLLFYKIVYEGSFVPFAIAGVFVALPIIGLCILLDTLYYGGGAVVLTSVNFLRVNVLEGLSKYFGDEPMSNYVFVFLPESFTVAYPVLLIALWFYYKEMRSKRQAPFLFYCTIFYIAFFSLIAHKEKRFMLPIIPFCFLMIGYLLARKIKEWPRTI
jgi:phosphatidylinositol glycan class B